VLLLWPYAAGLRRLGAAASRLLAHKATRT
jgi:hypothetical protein